MKGFYDNNILPALNRIDKLMGVKHIQVAYEPTLWVKDGSDFYCEHQELDTDTVTQYAPNYITGDCDDYEAVVDVCRDCREVLEK